MKCTSNSNLSEKIKTLLKIKLYEGCSESSVRDVRNIFNGDIRTNAAVCQTKVRSICIAKVTDNFSAKNITLFDFVSTGRFNKSSTNHFVKLTNL